MIISGNNNEQTLSVNQVCIARQPILDRNCNVVAYELLFRNAGASSAEINNAAEATINVIYNAFTNIGIETLLGGKKAYINFDASLLKSDITSILPRDKVIVELHEWLELDDELLSSLRRMHGEGYRFALDNCIHREGQEQIYQFADIIKLDVLQQSKESLVKQAEYFRISTKLCSLKKLKTRTFLSYVDHLIFDYFKVFSLPNQLL